MDCQNIRGRPRRHPLASGVQVGALKANNGFRKCQFMTWPEFEAWKRHFPETDPYGPRGAGDDSGGSSSGEEGGGLVQALLGNNCVVM